jgi:thiamine pyrophosphokinase
MIQPTKKTVLFVNGDLPAPDELRPRLNQEDLLIAVDGGLSHLANLALTPHLIIGDLDSADPDLITKYRSQGVEIRTFPPEKNKTDLELALEAALDLPPKTIWIVAALGGRVDQTLANIFLLARPELADFDVRLMDGRTEIFLIRESATIHGEVGQRVSLLPLNGTVNGIHTTGLKYPLKDETLYPNTTRGISNQMTAQTATLSLHNGSLLCIHDTST